MNSCGSPQTLGSARRARRLADIRAAHERYSAKQLENDKTRRVLEAGFGKEFADSYLRDVLFDESFEPEAAAEAAAV